GAAAKVESGIDWIRGPEDLTNVVVPAVAPTTIAAVKRLPSFLQRRRVGSWSPAQVFDIGPRCPFKEEEWYRLPQPVEAQQLLQNARSIFDRAEAYGSGALFFP